MLVLSRMPGQEIVIGGDVVVRVLDVHGDKVRLGIVAPKDVSVHRREVQEEIEREGRERKEGG